MKIQKTTLRFGPGVLESFARLPSGRLKTVVLRQPVVQTGERRETRASSESKGEIDHERARVGHEIGIGVKAATARRHRLAIHIRVVRVGMAETCADQAARRS